MAEGKRTRLLDEPEVREHTNSAFEMASLDPSSYVSQYMDARDSLTDSVISDADIAPRSARASIVPRGGRSAAVSVVSGVGQTRSRSVTGSSFDPRSEEQDQVGEMIGMATNQIISAMPILDVEEVEEEDVPYETSFPQPVSFSAMGKASTSRRRMSRKQLGLSVNEAHQLSSKKLVADQPSPNGGDRFAGVVQTINVDAGVTRREMRIMIPEFDRKVMQTSMACFVVALITCLLATLNMTLLWNYEEQREEATPVTQAIKVLNLILSIFLQCLVVRYYFVQAKIEQRKYYITGKVSSVKLFVRTSMKYKLLLEILLIAIMPYPFLDVLTSPEDRYAPFPLFNDKIGVFVYFRLYFIVRVLRDTSPVYKMRKDLMEDPGYEGPKFSWKMSLKTRFYDNSFVSIIAAYFFFFLLISLTLHMMERHLENSPMTFANSVWFTAYSMTSGEAVPEIPVGPLGLLAGVCAAVAGIVLMSILTSVITNKMSLSHHEDYAVMWMTETNLEKREMILAARLIQMAWLHKKKIRRIQHSLTPQQRVREDISYRLKSRRLMKKLSKTRGKLANCQMSQTDPLMRHVLSIETEQKEFAVAVEKRLDRIEGNINARFSALESAIADLAATLASGERSPRQVTIHE